MKYLLLTIFLVSCSQEPKTSLSGRIQQPSVLIFAPNTSLQTVNGIYKTNQSEREIWHSAKTVEDLEKKLSEF